MVLLVCQLVCTASVGGAMKLWILLILTSHCWQRKEWRRRREQWHMKEQLKMMVQRSRSCRYVDNII